jgi:hypothetical protein
MADAVGNDAVDNDTVDITWIVLMEYLSYGVSLPFFRFQFLFGKFNLPIFIL